MAKVVNHHHSALGLPLGGPVLPSGVETEVKRWNIIKGHAVVKAWLQARVIEEVGSDEPAQPEPAPGPSPEPLDDELTALRSEYQEKVGKRAYHGWNVEALKAKIAEANDAAAEDATELP
ncbi:MAG: hypothetical protein M9939_26655 [Mesorhizobium sp.]|nr:hypothetical protein [Mesorhizobium sp.]MCO5085148.1 hypothetical protein [Rhizobiaceae bacterium]MCO5164675.1 hypothetical protein [Mesorhizobium sp.]